MSFATAQLPLALRCFNTLAAALRRTGLNMIPLEPEALLSAASKATGLSDYGSDYFREPLRRLCESLEQDARLTGLGRAMAKQDILRLLSHRLQFEDTHKRHPEIAEQEIIAPIFILGMPRTGTTSLHELMALDDRFRVPMSWEVAYPFPPPETATYQSDPRIAQVDAELARVDKLLPAFRDMHPMGAQLPQECVALFSHDFASMIFDVQFRLQSYQKWLLHEDMSEVFRNHRRWLQLLQWRCPGETWVLKSPQYLWNIDDMLNEYPDARVVQTHRDPVKVAISIASLTATLRSLASNEVDLPEIASDYADMIEHGNRKTSAARQSGRISPGNILDIRFSDFLQSPLAAVESIYQHFDLPLENTVRGEMASFLQAGSESDRHGKHRYSADDALLDLEAERLRFADYQRQYNVTSESF